MKKGHSRSRRKNDDSFNVESSSLAASQKRGEKVMRDNKKLLKQLEEGSAQKAQGSILATEEKKVILPESRESKREASPGDRSDMIP